MRNKLAELNKKWKKENLPEIEIGMGLNTGDAIIGNLGSLKRFDYTAIGDNVNLASRLESITKQYGYDMIISESTYEKIKDKFVCKKLDKVAVKGKAKPITIYQVVGKEVKDKKEIELFESALEDYLNQDWKKAESKFKKINGKAAKLFLERINEFKECPPGKNWDGAFVMKTK